MHEGKQAVEWLRSMGERRHTLLSIDSELVRTAMAHVAELEEALSIKTVHDARNEAMEEAAAEVIKYRNRFPQYPGFPASDIAAAIRALKT